jgi:hypothetical protein
MTDVPPFERPKPSSRPTWQDKTVPSVKSAATLLANLLNTLKEQQNDPSAQHSASNYYNTLEKHLPGLAKNRWKGSKIFDLWLVFFVGWNGGKCNWKDVQPRLQELADALRNCE